MASSSEGGFTPKMSLAKEVGNVVNINAFKNAFKRKG